jgi:uncharacterized protein
MRVVSNTSPLSNLAIIGRLNLVREQLGIVVIPPAVEAELSRNPRTEARAALAAAMRQGWIQVRLWPAQWTQSSYRRWTLARRKP